MTTKEIEEALRLLGRPKVEWSQIRAIHFVAFLLPPTTEMVVERRSAVGMTKEEVFEFLNVEKGSQLDEQLIFALGRLNYGENTLALLRFENPSLAERFTRRFAQFRSMLQFRTQKSA